jgi:hypothetical protein
MAYWCNSNRNQPDSARQEMTSPGVNFFHSPDKKMFWRRGLLWHRSEGAGRLENNFNNVRFWPVRSNAWHSLCIISLQTSRYRPKEARAMTALDMRCAVDHFLRNGFLKLQYRLRCLGFPREAVVRGLFMSEQLLKGLKILR